MNRPRGFVFAIMIYVLFDACALGLPGAFVFDVDDCVEASLASGASRTVHSRMAVTATGKSVVLVQIPDATTSQLAAVAPERVYPPIACALRTRLYPPRSLEDPF